MRKLETPDGALFWGHQRCAGKRCERASCCHLKLPPRASPPARQVAAVPALAEKIKPSQNPLYGFRRNLGGPLSIADCGMRIKAAREFADRNLKSRIRNLKSAFRNQPIFSI